MPLIILSADAGAQPPLPAPAQSVAPGAQSIDAGALVAEVRRMIGERYVLPERRPALDAALAEGLRAGRYADPDPAGFAQRINADLERVGSDRHLSFSYDPARAAIMRSGTQEGPDVAAFERMVRAGNHGVRELRLLAGNVRYLDLRSFDWIGEDSERTLNAAMQFLGAGDAVIVDLRHNGGGSPRAVQQIISHFLEPDRPLVAFFESGEERGRLGVLRDLQAPRMIGKPLYVLTGADTGSAAEEFVGHVAGYHLGELVGANTSGGAYMNQLVPVGSDFVLSVSTGRAVLASTGADWEGVGFAPTIPVTEEAALDAAHANALRRLAGAAPAGERARLEAIADGVAARRGARESGLPLRVYAGVFGQRTITVEDGRLVMRARSGVPLRLIALGGHRFTFEDDPEEIVEFAVENRRATALTLAPAGGRPRRRFERTG